MVTVRGLRKTFRRSRSDIAKKKAENKKKHIQQPVEREVIAVDRLSFEAKGGEIFGLLGANGAGKTTTLRCVSTLYKPNDGEVLINGVDVLKDPFYARKHLAFLTSELKLDKYFSPDYTLTYYGRLHGMSEEQIARRKDELIELFEIGEFRHKKVGELSTGMLQKTSIAVSMIHDPDVIIFDEPTNGLDILTARKVTDFLIDQKKRGKTVIVSTHIMSLVEKICDRVAIIIRGALAIEGTVEEICTKTGQKDLEDAFFHLYNEAEAAAGDKETP